MKSLFILFNLTLLFILNGCTQIKEADIEAEKSKVKEVVDQFEQVWEQEDMELFSRIIAHDPGSVFYGTDAAEHFVGWDVLKKAAETMFPAFENIKITVRDQVIKVHSSGNVAWFSQIWDWDLIAEGQPVSVPDCRFTGVLEKRNNNWVFVQFHNSVPVSGQAAQY